MTHEQLQAKLDETRAQLTAFLEQANRQVAALEGAIAMLEGLLAEMVAEAAGGEGPQAE